MARGRTPWLTDEERAQRKIKQREYRREYARKRREALKAKGVTAYSLLSDEQKRKNAERHREWYQEKKNDPEFVERYREKHRVYNARCKMKKRESVEKKDFSDKEFSKWWHDKLESVRQTLNY